MVKTKPRLGLCIVLLCLNIAFIWGNSLLLAQLSRGFSMWVKGLLSWLLPAGETAGQDTGHHLLRKLAHFTEFACLGCLLSGFVRMVRERKWEQILLPLIAGIFVAAVDETIQFFVPGRGPGIKDVGIDTLGVSLGIVLITLYACIKQKNWRKLT